MALSEENRKLLKKVIKDPIPDDIISDVVPGSIAVPFFGNFEKAEIATIGINPSNKEFDEGAGRFKSRKDFGNLNLNQELSDDQTEEAFKSALNYFKNNPYKPWFGDDNDSQNLKHLVEAITGASYYSDDNPAVHLDIIPYPTNKKWDDIKNQKPLKDRAKEGSSYLNQILTDGDIKLLLITSVTPYNVLKEVIDNKDDCEIIDLPIKDVKYKDTSNHDYWEMYVGHIKKCRVLGWNCPPSQGDFKRHYSSILKELKKLV